MKHLFIITTFLVFTTIASAFSIELKSGIDFGTEKGDTNKIKLEQGYSFNVDFLFGKKFEYGIGAGYHQFGNTNSDTAVYSDKEYLSAKTLYGTAKYNFRKDGIKPYLKVNAGASFNEEGKYFDTWEDQLKATYTSNGYDSASINLDVNTGFYWAASLGLEYKSFLLEVLYESTISPVDAKGSITTGTTTNQLEISADDITIDTITIALGYKFGKGNN